MSNSYGDDYTIDDDYDDYDDYDWTAYDCPPVTLREVLRKWLRAIKDRIHYLLKPQDFDIPF